jgi:hypothetical protein
MKRILAGLFVLATICVTFATGAAPSAPTYGVRDWEGVDTTYTSANFDTINGTSDSTMLLENWDFEPGWTYVLYVAAPTDGGSGPEWEIHVRAEDYDGNEITTDGTVDTITTAAAYVVLPIGRTVFGHQYDLWLDAGAANEAENHILNQWGLFRYRETFPNYVTK